MEKNIQCLVQACRNLGIRYEHLDKEKNFLRVMLCGSWEYFQIYKTPFNSEVVYGVCKDKAHTYDLLAPVVRMPNTASFLDWNTDLEYKKYVNYHSETEVVEAMENQFEYPLIIKRNKGALGQNVYLCNERCHAILALDKVFNKESKHYDYVALAQQYIRTKKEYRFVCAFGEPVLTYQRGNTSGFNKRYWERGGKAILIEDLKIINALHRFVKPVFDWITIGFVGFDIIKGEDNKLYLIELNSSPKFNHVIEGNGQNCVTDMYEKALALFANYKS